MKKFFSRFFKAKSTSSSVGGSLSRSRSLRVEALEDRQLLAVVVDTALDLTADDGVTTLREALEQAAPNDVIQFSDQVDWSGGISLSEGRLTVDKSVTIDATSLYDTVNNRPGLTIDASRKSQIFYVFSFDNAITVELKGLLLTGGSAANIHGGAVYNNGETVTLTDCYLVGNSATNRGGGLYAYGGSTTVTNCSFINNRASSGGAAAVYGGVLTLDRIQFRENTGTNGGALCGEQSATITGENILFSRNGASSGSAVYGIGGAITLTGTTMTEQLGNLTVGSVIYSDGSNLNIRNSIIAENKTAREIYLRSGGIVGNNILSSYQDWSGNSSSNFNYDSSLPLFEDAENGIYRLAENSQALGGGSNNYVESVIDLAGHQRINSGGTVDLGAYESSQQGETREAPSVIVTTPDDVVDMFDGLISLREAISYANVSVGTTITFDQSLAGGVISLVKREMVIGKSITIDATGLYDTANNRPALAVDAGRNSRVFAISGKVGEIDVKIAGLEIRGGSADLGAGIYASSANVSIDRSFLTGNVASENGGGLCFVGESENVLTVTQSTFEANGAKNGGGLYVAGGILTIDKSQFLGNSAQNGGGLTATSAVVVSARDSLFAQNESSRLGGGIYVANSEFSGLGLTIADNAATTRGNGFYSMSSAVTLKNSIVAQNGGSDLDYRQGTVVGQNVLSSFVGWSDGSAQTLVYQENLPLFVDLDDGNYRLADNSQAWEKGNLNFLTLAEINGTDLDGGVRARGRSVDLGAYEKTIGDLIRKEAASTVVTTASDVVDAFDGVISLREAIAYAGTEGLETMVTFDSSLHDQTITVKDGEILIEKSIIIDASDLTTAGSDTPAIILSGGGANRIFAVVGTEAAKIDVTLKGLTLLNGSVTSETATGAYGGAVHAVYANLILDEMVFRENEAAKEGGAVSSVDSNLTIRHSSFQNNSAYGGGAIYFLDSHGSVSLAIADSEFSENKASSATSSGGAIYASSGNSTAFTIVGSRFFGNVAGYSGGAISANGTNLSAKNSLFYDNSATVESGGALYIRAGMLDLVNVTISANTARTGGDGIFLNTSQSATIKNSILADNGSGNGIGVNNATVVGLYSLSSFTGWGTGSANNLVYDNTKPLFTDAANYDYSLVAESQARDIGNNAYLSAGETDLAGKTRLRGTNVDAGAYEYQSDLNPIESKSAVVTILTDTNDRTDGQISLREAIDYAAALGQTTVTFDASLAGGTITLTEGEILLGQSIIIDASDLMTAGSDTPAITLSGDNASRVFLMKSANETFDVTLRGLTITDGSASGTEIGDDQGGGIYAQYVNLTIDRCLVTGNSAKTGGGLHYQSSDSLGLTITDSTFINNTATGDGGGISVNNGTVELDGVSIRSNTSGLSGGGIETSGAAVTIADSLITSNETTDGQGGGIQFFGYHTAGNKSLTMTDTIISSNLADQKGAGIFLSSGTANLLRVKVLKNETSQAGGGFFVEQTSLTLEDSLISDNSAQQGGGFYLQTGATVIGTGLTVAMNSASYGSGLLNNSQSVTLQNSIVALNQDSADISVSTDAAIVGVNVLSTYAGWSTGSANILQYSTGEALFTDELHGDYSLAATTKAINAGSHQLSATSKQVVTTGSVISYTDDLGDLAGNTRWDGTEIDLGAYEYHVVSQTAKNVILMIGDGMGFTTDMAGTYYRYGEGQSQSYHNFRQLASATFCLADNVASFDETSAASYSSGEGDTATNSLDGYRSSFFWKNLNNGRVTPTEGVTTRTTDSSASGSALNNGQKINFGYMNQIGLNGAAGTIELETTGQKASDDGKSVGAVSSVWISNATPATVMAHNQSRNNFQQISEEQIKEQSGLTVLMGAGDIRYIYPGNTSYNHTTISVNNVGGATIWNDILDDNKYIDASGNTVTYIGGRDEFAALAEATPDSADYADSEVTRLLGVVHAAGCMDPVDGDIQATQTEIESAEVPTLSDMSVGALNVLSHNTEGFYLMIEGGAIDYANHNDYIGNASHDNANSQTERILYSAQEHTAFTKAIDAVIEWVETYSSWEETLLIITADHETGQLWGSGTYVDKNDNMKWDSGETFNGFQHIVNNGQGNAAGGQYCYGNHTNALVPVWLYGAGADLVDNYIRGYDETASDFYGEDGYIWGGEYIYNSDIGKLAQRVLQVND